MILPDYTGGSIAGVMPALLAPGRPAPWLPDAVRDADQVVLLVLDGVGWLQLMDRSDVAPCLTAMARDGGPITSVAPTTTSAALCSIVFGAPPAAHGVLGYRVRVGEGDVLNVLRWRTTSGGDARELVPPSSFVADGCVPFGGRPVPAVTRAEFAGTGFTAAMLPGVPLVGWQLASSIAVDVGALLRAGHPFVYAYYDGVDKVAHSHGLGAHYDAELAAADRIVADVAAALPPGAALVVTSDHGQVDVGDRIVALDDDVLAEVALHVGESRFRWLHARPDRADALAAACRRYEESGLAWVRTLEEAEEEGWFGGPLSDAGRSRVGDVVLAAREPIGFADPGDNQPLRCRHGSLTAEEMLVPLVGTARRRS